ncbi:DUF2147 domain-containing protein [Devosia submarina]|uniref:DUF2147 domain-containing protein n=1 Tax=Devosia submarina TaxID=1173082 RepID=UPI001300BB2B|nr:DUF2147 domain-containing protein [Devosia submarina]
MSGGIVAQARLRGGLAIGLCALGLQGIAAQDVLLPPPHPIEGTWRTVLNSEVTIAACPEGFCGTLSNIVVPSEGLTAEELAAAQAMPPESFTDQRNKDPNLRSRPMLGLQILTLRPSDEPHVLDGDIYNPQDGNTYSGYVEMLGPDQVRLNGCVLFNVLCRGEDWVRVIPEPEDGAAAQ